MRRNIQCILRLGGEQDQVEGIAFSIVGNWGDVDRDGSRFSCDPGDA